MRLDRPAYADAYIRIQIAATERNKPVDKYGFVQFYFVDYHGDGENDFQLLACIRVVKTLKDER